VVEFVVVLMHVYRARCVVGRLEGSTAKDGGATARRPVAPVYNNPSLPPLSIAQAHQTAKIQAGPAAKLVQQDCNVCNKWL